MQQVGILASSPVLNLSISLASEDFQHCHLSVEIPNRTWCLSRQRIQKLRHVQMCREKPHESRCKGILLVYVDGTFETLGQVRYDLHLSEPWSLQTLTYRNVCLGHAWQTHVLAGMMDQQSFEKFPLQGFISWWTCMDQDYISIEEPQ